MTIGVLAAIVVLAAIMDSIHKLRSRRLEDRRKKAAIPKPDFKVTVDGQIERTLVSDPELLPLPDPNIQMHTPNPSDEYNWEIFISHTNLDEAYLRQHIVGKHDVRFFMMNCRSASQEIALAYAKRIMVALGRASWFVVAVSAAAARSPWVNFEVRWALKYRDRTRIRALLLDATAPSIINPGLRGVKTIDCRRDPETALRRLLKGIPQSALDRSRIFSERYR